MESLHTFQYVCGPFLFILSSTDSQPYSKTYAKAITGLATEKDKIFLPLVTPKPWVKRYGSNPKAKTYIKGFTLSNVSSWRN